MSRLPLSTRLGILRAQNRRLALEKLLNEFDWQANGYANQLEWLRSQYSPAHDRDLLFKCQQHFEKEGWL